MAFPHYLLVRALHHHTLLTNTYSVMLIKDPKNGSEYAVRKHAAELIGDDEILFDKLDGEWDIDPLFEENGNMSFRQRVLKSIMEEFKEKRGEIIEREQNRSAEEQGAQRDRMKELLMRIFEGKDPQEALNKDDREQFEKMADLQALQAALAEFEVKWSIIMN